jgi:small subunit ribosomal protein S20
VAQHKSAKKRIRQTVVKTQNNKVKISRARTEIKKLRALITGKETESAKTQLIKVQSIINKTAKTSALTKKTAARVTSRLASQVSALS